MAQQKSFSLSVLTYNIHKGLSPLNRKMTLKSIKTLLHKTNPDIVMLQEVIGSQHKELKESQYEYLADQLWSEFAYGKNADNNQKHYGNCILSRYPIESWNNLDISTNKFEKRGLLHAKIKIPSDTYPTLNIMNTHLDLLLRGRKKQVVKITKYIKESLNHNTPLILCGDFNDWTQKITTQLKSECELHESFFHSQGKHIRTFPSVFPILKLDRIYYRNMISMTTKAINHPKNISDHIALYTEFQIKG